MALHHFINERRPVLIAGRRYVLRLPTIATVETFLALYADEVETLLGHDLAEGAELLVPMFTMAGDGRAARVLRTCVESAVKLETWPVAELAQCILALSNVRRIAGSLGLGKDHAAGSKGNPAAQVAAIIRLACRFGVTPFEVMDWPFEAYLDIVDALPYVDGDGDPPEHAGHHPDFLAEMRKAAKPIRRDEN